MDWRAAYERDGFLVIEGFLDGATCDALIERAGQIVRAFRPEAVSIFTTHEQTRRSDDYFLESGGEICCFFEEDAFGPDGALRSAFAGRALTRTPAHSLHR